MQKLPPLAAVAATVLIWACPGSGAAASGPLLGWAAAPGRVAYPVSATVDDEEFPAVAAATPTADGGMMTAGATGFRGTVVLARLRSDGSLDRSFGAGGMSRLPIPETTLTYATPRALLAAPGGAAYVIACGPQRGRTFAPLIVRVRADGRIDPAYGTDGTAVGGIDEWWSAGAAVQPDGSVLVGGSADTAGAVERFTPSGAPDPSFGSNGIGKLPTPAVGPIAALSDDAIAVVGGFAGKPAQLVVLTREGQVDPGFDGGVPRDLGAPVGGLVARPDGAMDVLLRPYEGRAGRVLRIRRDGSTDPAFPAGGVELLRGAAPTSLTPAPGGAELVTALEGDSSQVSAMRAVRLLPDGRPDPAWGGADGARLTLPFGGGVLDGPWPADGNALRQSGVMRAMPIARPSGGLIVAASLQINAYGGSGGVGVVQREVGAAAFGDDLALDPVWGAHAAKPRIVVQFPRVSARGLAHARWGRVVIGARASSDGIVRIEALVRGRVVARAVARLHGGRPQPVFVPLTPYGRSTLARDARALVTVRADFRDFVARVAHTTSHVRLR